MALERPGHVTPVITDNTKTDTGTLLIRSITDTLVSHWTFYGRYHRNTDRPETRFSDTNLLHKTGDPLIETELN